MKPQPVSVGVAGILVAFTFIGAIVCAIGQWWIQSAVCIGALAYAVVMLVSALRRRSDQEHVTHNSSNLT